jgi:hypothetical protein
VILALQVCAIDLASEAWKLDWVEGGGSFHAKMECGYGFWKVMTISFCFNRDVTNRLLQELPDSLCRILDAALVSLKNPELVHAAQEHKIQRESDLAAASNAETAFGKNGDAARPLDSDRTLASSGKSTSRTSDVASEDSQQTM